MKSAYGKANDRLMEMSGVRVEELARNLEAILEINETNRAKSMCKTRCEIEKVSSVAFNAIG
jgi:hypothetical protein